MKLLQARIRGLGPVPETEWFELGPGLNVITSHSLEMGKRLLQSLQTLNPPYECKSLHPFADFPSTYEWHGSRRQVQPEKRTVAIGVFAAPPGFVTEMGAINDNLYEIDRVEVGRRLDYSRWVNFVELASSTRWSEAEKSFATVLDVIKNSQPELYEQIRVEISNLNSTDRITESLADSLLTLLDQVELRVPEESDTIYHLKTLCSRDKDFKTAKQITRQRLPLFSYTSLQRSDIPSLEAALANTAVYSRERFGTEPIFLFEQCFTKCSAWEYRELKSIVNTLSSHSQIIYLAQVDSPFQPVNGKRHRLEDLVVKNS